jgi:dihydroorotase
MLGVETAFAVAMTRLVAPGTISLAEVLGALCWRPARIAGLDAHGHGLPIAPGNPANLAVLDLERAWTVERDRLASRSRNTPWQGWELRGKTRHTILRGEPVVIMEEPQR